VPATSAGLLRLLFLQWPLTVLMKQTRQAECSFKQSIALRCLWSKHIFHYRQQGDTESGKCSKPISYNTGRREIQREASIVEKSVEHLSQT
jgi:hypothetical protein